MGCTQGKNAAVAHSEMQKKSKPQRSDPAESEASAVVGPTLLTSGEHPTMRQMAAAKPKSPSTREFWEGGSCSPLATAPHAEVTCACAGEVGKADGIQFYHVGAGPNGLLLLPDVFGWNGGRIRALADELARRGLNVWIPKMLMPLNGGTDGDGLPPDFDVATRMSEVRELVNGLWNVSATLPLTQKVIAAMRGTGVEQFAIVGSGYGCWLGFHLSISKEVCGAKLVCGASPHPGAHVETMAGGDPAELARLVQCPWALYPCGEAGAGGDPAIYDEEGAVFQGLEAVHPGKNETKRYRAMRNGFLTRGDAGVGSDDGEIQQAVQECLSDIMRFFSLHDLVAAPESSNPSIAPGGAEDAGEPQVDSDEEEGEDVVLDERASYSLAAPEPSPASSAPEPVQHSHAIEEPEMLFPIWPQVWPEGNAAVELEQTAASALAAESVRAPVLEASVAPRCNCLCG